MPPPTHPPSNKKMHHIATRTIYRRTDVLEGIWAAPEVVRISLGHLPKRELTNGRCLRTKKIRWFLGIVGARN